MALRAAKDNMLKKAHVRAAKRDILWWLDQIEEKSNRLTGEQRVKFKAAFAQMKGALEDVEK